MALNNLSKNVNDAVYSSPWRNSYWFARMLLNTDQYGAIGKKESLMQEIAIHLETALSNDNLNDAQKIKVCLDIIMDKVSTAARAGSKTERLYTDFVFAIADMIKCVDDLWVLVVTIRYVVLPTNFALNNVPSDDVLFCKETAKHILDSLGKKEVGRVLASWDTLGVRGCLDVERSELVAEFTKLRTNLSALSVQMSEVEYNAVLTAFVQEFERRAGQKRKSRAGGSLEDVATFLFDYYGFSSHPTPDHFQTDIEVDKWFKCTDGWSIGISCKRTLRERWKQVSSADGNSLSRYKIKSIWHLLTYDRDLSDDKITMLGQQRQIFYLYDESPIYKHAIEHIGMKDYVRPLSSLVDDIACEQGTTR
jgi:hypothetical protein